MRTILGLFAAIAVMGISACSDDTPDDIPRTVPPASANGAVSTAPDVKGVGPTIEADAMNAAAG